MLPGNGDHPTTGDQILLPLATFTWWPPLPRGSTALSLIFTDPIAPWPRPTMTISRSRLGRRPMGRQLSFRDPSRWRRVQQSAGTCLTRACASPCCPILPPPWIQHCIGWNAGESLIYGLRTFPYYVGAHGMASRVAAGETAHPSSLARLSWMADQGAIDMHPSFSQAEHKLPIAARARQGPPGPAGGRDNGTRLGQWRNLVPPQSGSCGGALPATGRAVRALIRPELGVKRSLRQRRVHTTSTVPSVLYCTPRRVITYITEMYKMPASHSVWRRR